MPTILYLEILQLQVVQKTLYPNFQRAKLLSTRRVLLYPAGFVPYARVGLGRSAIISQERSLETKKSNHFATIQVAAMMRNSSPA